MVTRSRQANQNWRGGRIVTPDGYVMIRVGKNHHLADCRGYAYEHRMVAECNLGRDLVPGEQVHHRDEDDRANNDWSNLEVCASLAEHRVKHRRVVRKIPLRTPDQDNPLVDCACGCGKQFRRFDAAGRPRRVLSGHNMRVGRLLDGVQHDGVPA